MDVLRTDAHDDFLANVGFVHQLANLRIRHLDGIVAKLGPNAVRTLDQLRVEEVHLRAADEGADEQVGRIIVEVLRGIDLLDEAVLHDDDTRAHGHGLSLVMGNIDKGRLETLMQLGDLGAHLHAELRVQVGERFVHQEDLRITHDGAAEGDALTLAAGERLRLAVEQLLDGQDLRSFTHELVDLILRLLAQLQAKRHVIVYGHVRIECVVLEHHRDIAVLRSHIVDQTIADVKLTLGNLFKTRDHTERRGLAAAGRADQNDKLLILDVQTEIGNSGHVAGIDFVDVVKLQACHNENPPCSVQT